MLRIFKMLCILCWNYRWKLHRRGVVLEQFKDTWPMNLLHRLYPNVQHLNSPKKCCTLGTLLHIGDIAQEKWDFLKNILVFDFSIFGLFFPLRKNHKTKNARKKVNLIVKREGLSLLETHSVRETTFFFNFFTSIKYDFC